MKTEVQECFHRFPEVTPSVRMQEKLKQNG